MTAASKHAMPRTYARLVRPILARLPDRQGALDIGAGDGALLQELLGLGFSDVCGAEPSAAPNCRRGRENTSVLATRAVSCCGLW